MVGLKLIHSSKGATDVPATYIAMPSAGAVLTGQLNMFLPKKTACVTKY